MSENLPFAKTNANQIRRNSGERASEDVYRSTAYSRISRLIVSRANWRTAGVCFARRRGRYAIIATKRKVERRSSYWGLREGCNKRYLVRRGGLSLLVAWSGSFPRALDERIFLRASAQVSFARAGDSRS